MLPSRMSGALSKSMIATDSNMGFPGNDHELPRETGKRSKIPPAESSARTAMDIRAHYADVQSVYDRMATEYDETIGRTLVSRHAKTIAVELITRLSPPTGSLLDVGCYTGSEALLLAARGSRVVGVGLSAKVVGLARGTVKRRRLQDG